MARQHRAFRPAGRAGGVELDRDVLPPDLGLRVVGALRVAPGGIVLPFRRAAFGGHDRAQFRQLRSDRARLRHAFRPDEQHGRLAIGNDEGDLGRGKPPVHGRHHHIGFHRAQQQFEIDVAVLAEIGDAFLWLDAKRLQSVGDAIGQFVEFGEGGLPSLEFKDDFSAARLRKRAHHFGKVCRCRRNGHVLLPMSCSCLAQYWRRCAAKTIWRDARDPIIRIPSRQALLRMLESKDHGCPESEVRTRERPQSCELRIKQDTRNHESSVVLVQKFS